MKKLFVIGDLHFSTSRPWDYESFENFLKWFEKYDFGKYEECELIQLGDVTEKGTNTGTPMEMMTEFFSSALKRFNHIYVLGGNHCHKLVNDTSQFVTQYLPLMSDNISVIYDEKEFMTDSGMNVLALPYKHTDIGIEKYYNECLDKSMYENQHDLICGHVCLYDDSMKYIPGVDLKKFKYRYASFGHIHSRIGKNAKYYTGSVMPFKTSEEFTELPRCIKVFTKEKELDEIKLPTFRHYQVIDFNKESPQNKKFSGDIVYIYELSNCRNKSSAKELYKNYYFKFGQIENISLNEGDFTKLELTKKLFDNNFTAFQKMCEEQNLQFKRKTQILIRQLLA